MSLLTRAAGALGFVRKAAVPRAFQDLEGGGWHSMFPRSPFDFDRDVGYTHDALLGNWTVFACQTLIAGDMGKMRAKLMEQDTNGIWNETQSNAFSPVLRKPNDYQTWQKFIESWMFSKLSRGNAYVLKERDDRKVVRALHVLDPDRVTVHVAESGKVYYRLADDNLAGVPDDGEVFVPASEIIHDRMWCLFHPLIGLSPIFACGLAATQGMRIQANSATFFANMSRPSGTLTSPGFLTDEQADIYKKRWNDNYGPGKQGGTAILGNGLVYSAMTQTALDSQLVEQLKLTAEMICSTLHVPPYKVGVGPMPPYQSAEILDQIYYDVCLQTLIKSVDSLLTDGLGLPNVKDHAYRVELDLDDLLRMNEGALTDVLVKQAGGGLSKIDEARKRLNLPPVPGGNTAYLQQQNYSLAALAKRDAKEDPFAGAKPAPAPAAPAPAPAPASPPTPDGKAIAAEIAQQLSAEVRERAAQAVAQVEAAAAVARDTAEAASAARIAEQERLSVERAAVAEQVAAERAEAERVARAADADRVARAIAAAEDAANGARLAAERREEHFLQAIRDMQAPSVLQPAAADVRKALELD